MKRRIVFQNWQPDVDDLPNEGLEDCINVVHEPEGYKPVYLESSGAFSTTGGMEGLSSVVAKTVGPNLDKFLAWLVDGPTPTLRVALNGSVLNGGGSTLTSFATQGSNQAICFFDVAEYGGEILFTVEAQQDEAGGTVNTVRITGRTTDAALS